MLRENNFSGVARAQRRIESHLEGPKARLNSLLLVLAVFCLGLSLGPRPVGAQSAHPLQIEDAPIRRITLVLFKSKTFHLDKPFVTAVVGSPDIADVLPMS